jgi:hypothetical protein
MQYNYIDSYFDFTSSTLRTLEYLKKGIHYLMKSQIKHSPANREIGILRASCPCRFFDFDPKITLLVRNTYHKVSLETVVVTMFLKN